MIFAIETKSTTSNTTPQTNETFYTHAHTQIERERSDIKLKNVNGNQMKFYQITLYTEQLDGSQCTTFHFGINRFECSLLVLNGGALYCSNTTVVNTEHNRGWFFSLR